MALGENIKRLRKDKGLTQLKLASEAGISRSYLADVENNRYNPSLDTLHSIANSLSVPVSELLGEEEVKITSTENIDKIVKENKLQTLAAHFDGEEFTDKDVADIERFINMTLAKKNK